MVEFNDIIKAIGIEPYYRDWQSDIVIYNADCRDILPLIPDKSIDLVLTDPPYGDSCDLDNKSDTRWSKKNGFSDLWIENQHGKWNIKPDANVFEELNRVGIELIIWGGNYFNLGATPCFLIWDKGQRDFSFADAEIAWTSLKQSIRIFDYARSKLNTEREHPTQKPTPLIEWCILQVNNAQFILDPFLGSGTTAVACKILGRKCIGIELEEKYCKIAAQRLAQGVLC